MASAIIQIRGHIIDSLILPKILDEIMNLDGTFEILDIRIGKRKTDPSTARLQIRADSQRHLDQILQRLSRLGATPVHIKDAHLVQSKKDGVFPSSFYS